MAIFAFDHFLFLNFNCMNDVDWAGELCVAITVSDTSGKILYMNDKSAATFDKNGGRELVGKSLQDCHLPVSWEKILNIMNSQQVNCYTVEKEGTKKLIYQAPWYDNGKLSGLVELSMVIPFIMDHFVRK
jgi:transcriptional regulator with PAS, ATPase and Fis domain